MYVYNELVEFILWKEGFNSDGHQFHQYQQNNQNWTNWT